MNYKILIFLLIFLFGGKSHLNSCTIFSAKDKNGHVWVGNNEDFVFTFYTYLNIVHRTDSTFGYIYFSYFDIPEEPQGGVNEAGLFFDINAIDPSKTNYKDYSKKKDYPGGITALMYRVLSKCRTVNEVFNLFDKYRIQGFEGTQLHLADKYGNLGIIVADSMWITQSNYQVSTNYNLCHPDKDGIACWRYPIADRILKTNKPNFETFKMVCDSTSQKSAWTTLYSNIHNLNTGEIWLLYGLDYENAYKTTINDLLISGDSLIVMHKLFLQEPLVKAYYTFNSHGAKKSLKKLNDYQLPPDKKNNILRLLSQEIIIWNHNFKGYNFLSSYIKSENNLESFWELINTVSLFSLNKNNRAIKLLKEYISGHPNSSLGPICLNQMQGKFDKDANVKFEVTGYPKAKSIFVDGFSFPNLTYFLVKSKDKWIGEFNIAPGEYLYSFSVDGLKVLDPQNPDIIKKQGIDFNRIIVKK